VAAVSTAAIRAFGLLASEVRSVLNGAG